MLLSSGEVAAPSAVAALSPSNHLPHLLLLLLLLLLL